MALGYLAQAAISTPLGVLAALAAPAYPRPMSSSAPALATASIEDLLAIPAAERRHEIVDGELVRKAMPSGPHGRAQFRLGTEIGGPYDRRAGNGGPGGWVPVPRTAS